MTRARTKHLGAALLLGLLSACQEQPRSQPVPPHPAARVPPPASHRLTDRGIGGTGAPKPAPAQTADRGIGGTGIVGIITGFGSVLVDGMEIRYDEDAPVDIDGTAATAADLRTGQLVAIEAEGPATALHATKISIQSAVAGRIDPPGPGAATLTVSGQPVLIPSQTQGAEKVSAGQWVRVSGLRRDDGVIVATRLDPAPAGTLLVKGPLARDAGGARIGTLILPPAIAAGIRTGQFVIVSGDQASGSAAVTGAAPDPLDTDPAAWFDPADDTLILQAYLRVQNGTISVNGLTVTPQAALAARDLHDGPAIIALRREPNGSYTADSVRYTDEPGQDGRHTDGGAGQGEHIPGQYLHDRTSDRRTTAVRHLAKANPPVDIRPDPAPPETARPAGAKATPDGPAAPIESPALNAASDARPPAPEPPGQPPTSPRGNTPTPENPGHPKRGEPLTSDIGGQDSSTAAPSPVAHPARPAMAGRHRPATKTTAAAPSPGVLTGAVTTSDIEIAPPKPPATPAPIVSAPAARHTTPKPAPPP